MEKEKVNRNGRVEKRAVVIKEKGKKGMGRKVHIQNTTFDRLKKYSKRNKSN